MFQLPVAEAVALPPTPPVVFWLAPPLPASASQSTYTMFPFCGPVSVKLDVAFPAVPTVPPLLPPLLPPPATC